MNYSGKDQLVESIVSIAHSLDHAEEMNSSNDRLRSALNRISQHFADFSIPFTGVHKERIAYQTVLGEVDSVENGILLPSFPAAIMEAPDHYMVDIIGDETGKASITSMTIHQSKSGVDYYLEDTTHSGLEFVVYEDKIVYPQNVIDASVDNVDLDVMQIYTYLLFGTPVWYLDDGYYNLVTGWCAEDDTLYLTVGTNEIELPMPLDPPEPEDDGYDEMLPHDPSVPGYYPNDPGTGDAGIIDLPVVPTIPVNPGGSYSI